MNYKLTLRVRADLLEIYNYGLVMFGEHAAERYQNELKDLFDRLVDFPLIGRFHTKQTRRFSHWPYIIIYSNDDSNGLIIQAVLHGRQDWKEIDE